MWNLAWLRAPMNPLTGNILLYVISQMCCLEVASWPFYDKKLITRWEYPNVTWRISFFYLSAYLSLSTDSTTWTGTSIGITLNLNLTSQNVYRILMCGLRIFAGPSIYRLSGNVISAAVGLVCINLQRECELPSWTHFGQFQKFGRIQFGTLSSPAIPKKKFLHGDWLLVHVRVRFDLPSSNNFRYINGFSKLGPQNPY